ncbi:MAG: tetratricopeptide repeat protein, partial [Bacteroidota bacterium]
PHINITDHYISKDNTKGNRHVKTNEEAAFLGLQILTKKSAEPLEMAKAYLALYDKYLPAPMILDSTFYYLNLVNSKSTEQFKTLIHYYFNRQDYSKIIALSQQPVEFQDAWTAYRIGEAFYKSGNLPSALNYYQLATTEMPYHLEFQEKLGTTQIQLQQIPQAIKTLEWVLQEDETRAIAWCNLGYAYLLKRQVDKALNYYDRAIALNPDYEQALLNKAAVKLLQKEVKTAQSLLNRVLQINPENAQAKAILEQLNLNG